jgi:SAP domain
VVLSNFFCLNICFYSHAAKEWWVKSDTYALRRSDNRLSESLDDETIEYINERLKERWDLKGTKNFDAADEIRDELREQYGVTIDDRLMEWFVEVDQYTVVDREFTDRESSIKPIPSYSFEDYKVIEDEVGDFDEMATLENGVVMSKTENVDLENLTVPELKERLRALGLPVSGRKAELVERLAESSSSSRP